MMLLRMASRRERADEAWDSYYEPTIRDMRKAFSRRGANSCRTGLPNRPGRSGNGWPARWSNPEPASLADSSPS
eukprot:11220340-Lingulodinium_polyedra.AAC.1